MRLFKTKNGIILANIGKIQDENIRKKLKEEVLKKIKEDYPSKNICPEVADFKKLDFEKIKEIVRNTLSIELEKYEAVRIVELIINDEINIEVHPEKEEEYIMFNADYLK